MASLAAPAFAQENDEVIVTGSRLTSANVISTSPITAIDEEAFKRTGAIDAIDVLNRLPSVTAAQDSNVSNGATGTSSLNLRGLGTNRNLVLIDGKRLGPGTPDISSADLNQIPTPLLERVEVVTGGASAVYGSDAIAGVANFILRHDFEGVEINATAGVFVDSNSNSFAQDVTDQTSTDGITPRQTEVDGFTKDISIVFGTSFADDAGHITAYARYVDQQSVLQGDRDISRCAIVDFGPVAGNDVFCVGSNFGPFPTTFTLGAIRDPNTGLPLNPQPGIVGVVSLDPSGGVTRDANGDVVTGSSNAFNFNPTNFFQRPTERLQGGFLANYDVNENVEVYLDAFFFRNTTDAQIAPSATFGEVQQINCDNPFLTADLLDIICTQRGFTGTDIAQVQVNRRFVEGGGRNTFIELDNLRLVGGVRGEIGNTGWDYDVFGQYSTTSSTQTNTNDANITLLQEALLVRNDANGNPVCTSGRAGCLPLNLFGTSAVDTTALANVLTPTIQSGEITQQIIGGTIQGELENFKFPGADAGVSVLVGAEYRKDVLKSQPDSILIVGGATGLGGPADPVSAQDEVKEVFAEVAIPVITGGAFAEELSLSGQIRYSDYDYANSLPGGAQSNGFSTTAYSGGVSWVPVNDIRFRAQYQRSVRAPNVFELFSPVSLGLFNDSDPCSGTIGSANLTATQAQCVATGLPAALYGFVAEDAGQLQQLGGGNVGLNPEKSDTITFGAVIQPSFVEGLTVSLDYFDISVDDFITNIPSTSVLDGCIDGSQPIFCTFIHRDNLGTLQVNGFIDANLQNIASRSSKGVDINARYNFNTSVLGMGDHGDLTLDYISTIYTSLEQTSFPGAAVTDCNGVWGGSCFTGEPNPKYAHTASLTWDTKHDVSVTTTWRYTGKVTSQGNEVPVGGIGNVFGDENYFDLFTSWEAHEMLTLNFGVNNLFDNDPPISDFRFTGNGNTFPSTYDSAGRYIFMGAKIKL